MSHLAQLWRRCSHHVRRDRFDRELEEEVRFHLEMKAEEYVAAGMTPEEALQAARRQFGNETRLREMSRETWGFVMMETFLQDVRYGARVLAKHKGFTAVAVLTLALGIGANTAIFSVVNDLLLRPLPYSAPERLVRVYEKRVKLGRTRNVVSAPDFLDWREQNKVFDAVSAYTAWDAALTSGDEPRQVSGTVASADLFQVLRAAPMMGRV